jgi:hypothetical protein
VGLKVMGYERSGKLLPNLSRDLKSVNPPQLPEGRVFQGKGPREGTCLVFLGNSRRQLGCITEEQQVVTWTWLLPGVRWEPAGRVASTEGT